MILKDIKEELQFVLKGKTLDALVPPSLFVFTQNSLGLTTASILALSIALLFALWRARQGQSVIYAGFGALTVALAASYAWWTASASNYFLPGFISGSGFSLLILSTILLKKPFVAWVSHLTRGWPLDWFWRPDIRPAYTEITWVWFFFFTGRLLFQYQLFLNEALEQLVLWNLVLGPPALIVLLIFTYVFGLWRLNRLKGPSVDEFIQDKKPPYEGQKRGF